MTTRVAHKIRLRGTVESRHEANDLLEAAGDSVLVVRGRPRSFVIACPDGCGAILTVNLDPKAGKAWKLYERGRTSLYPSVWRNGGCGAHFIVWKDRIVWCGPLGVDDNDLEYDAELEAKIIGALSTAPRTDWEIAQELDEIPWEVGRTLRRLLKTGRVGAIGTRPIKFMLPDSEESNVSGRRPSGPPKKKRSWWSRLWKR